jgi:hypothetical protein
MRAIVAAVLFVLLTSQPSLAQAPAPADQARAMRQARLKIWTGIALISAGLIALPRTSGHSDGDRVVASVATMGVGSGLVYWGFRQQQKAASPSTSFGIAVGRTTAIVIKRAW